ncbi:hypothetical protein K432DRAFT_388029 [Lepidopterella palustris CBS 459.81]|uniref:PH domain-containing protein n=1 Tax=Lepidopterella palustris CBS 459.81 TaxID=1314670 RepID=A0A8E2JKW8_9PEZI|nr:hypothetical protein K432DRAFT_388029 [Lepidopterella palustris CBS 459.81]
MAAAKPQTLSQGLYNSVPTPSDPLHLSRGYGPPSNNNSHLNIDGTDFATTPGNPVDSSPLSQSLQPQRRVGRFEEDFDASQRGSSVLLDGDMPHRSASAASTLNQGATPSRSGTLKKKASVRRTGSLRRSGSRRSIHAGSIHGVGVDDDEHVSSKQNSVFFTPIPTTGTPTEILANRFQAWRKLLKDLITYFREVQASYEHRAKALIKVSNVINNTNAPSAFLTEGGLNEATRILRDFHKQTIVESNKARDIENEVITQLSGLRADLGQKIKEIKSLSGDFKNSVEKEKESTRKAVAHLEEALSLVDSDPSAVAGKGDPFVVRLAVDRQVERQIDEENYLHRAYLNLENSGRELESIIVGEIQKSYNALAGILKRDADECYETVNRLRNGPIGLPKDLEWNQFVEHDPHFVNPRVPLRRLEDIEYPGKNHPATAEVRAGMLERKSKYLKSYTPGWYVLSPTHLHEFKSADRIYTQPPVMSLYLPDQKLGSHSQPGGSSHKFVLKGRQTGSMHRGHSWVFRAESYDTMLAWFEDIKNLTEKSGEERNAFVRRHTRSVSQGSQRSVSSDGGMDEDEADEVPFSVNQSIISEAARDEPPDRPSPGGRFPSDVQVNRHLQAPLSPSSGSSDIDHDLTSASGGLQGSYLGSDYQEHETNYELGKPQQQQEPMHSQQYGQPDNTLIGGPSTYQQEQQQQQQRQPIQPLHPIQPTPAPYPTSSNPTPSAYQPEPPPISSPQQPIYPNNPPNIARHNSSYGDWMAPAAGGAAAGGLAAEAYRRRQQKQQHDPELSSPTQEPTPTTAPVSRSEVPAPVPLTHVPPSEPASLTSTISTISTSISSDTIPKKPPLDMADTAPVAASSSTYMSGETPMHEMGQIFPTVMRHNTDISVSDLHVPGQYPKAPAAT